MKYYSCLALMFALSLFSAGCSEPVVYTYTEKETKPEVDRMAMSGTLPEGSFQSNTAGLSWTLPEGWVEADPKPMRVATFQAGSNEVSIIILPGDAGGVKANIERWLKQLDMVLPDDVLTRHVREMERVQIKGGLEAAMVDLEAWGVERAPEDPSVLGAIIALDNASCFIKMTGSQAELNQERTRFYAFVHSLRI